MRIFGNGSKKIMETSSTRKDFEYLQNEMVYFDSACQTLRPQPVLDAMLSYFQEFNACGGRVKYAWGKRVDDEVEAVRTKILHRLGKSEKEYVVAFTLNTTYGINLLLNQLPVGVYTQIITSEIEHNSVFLPTMTVAKRLTIPRKILKRTEGGSLEYQSEDMAGAVVVVNVISNFDGRILLNAKTLVHDLHKQGGILVLDGAQCMAHDSSFLHEVDFDALCFSGHKTYAPSLGIIVAKKQLVDSLDLSFVGGGMVEKLDENNFTFPTQDPACKLEPGLQDFAGIVGLGATMNWLESYKPEGQKQSEHQLNLATMIFDGLSKLPHVRILNSTPTSIISFHSEKIDSHRLATFLSQQNIMVRSGYFCCHYYLQNVKKYPPLTRVSIGLHNTEADVHAFLNVMEKIIKNIE